MRIALLLVLALLACDTETIELADEDAAEDASAEDAAPEDAAPEDAAAEDAAADGGPDMGPPDSGPECVCRYVMCRNDLECERIIGSGNSCDPRQFFCSGSVGTCTSDSDCGGAEWTCSTSSVSLDPC